LSRKIIGFIVRPSFLGRRRDRAGGEARSFGLSAGAIPGGPGGARESTGLCVGRQRTVQEPFHDLVDAPLDPEDDVHAAAPNHGLGVIPHGSGDEMLDRVPAEKIRPKRMLAARIRDDKGSPDPALFQLDDGERGGAPEVLGYTILVGR